MRVKGDTHQNEPHLKRFQHNGMFLLILVISCSTLFHVKTSFFACDTISGATTIVNEKAAGPYDVWEDDIMSNEEKEERQWPLSRDTTSRQSHVVNYKLESSKFIQIMSDCITDEYCHIHYLHTTKTGGTTVESHFSNLFGLNIISCCGEYITRGFQIHRRKMKCSKEIIAVQFNASDFMNIPIKTCLDVYANQSASSNATRKHHIVALATFREPIAKTLSQIHQKCNKNLIIRTEDHKAMCERCDYDQDQSEWNRLYVDETNSEYTSIYNDLILGTAGLAIPVLTIDSLDISSFFQWLKTSLPSEYASKLEDSAKIKNGEISGRCNFGFRSAMMKNLQPSLEVYRNLTSGW